MDSHSRLKTFVLPKDIVKKIKSHAKSGRKFSQNISDKKLDSRIYKELLQFNKKKTNKSAF